MTESIHFICGHCHIFAALLVVDLCTCMVMEYFYEFCCTISAPGICLHLISIINCCSFGNHSVPCYKTIKQ